MKKIFCLILASIIAILLCTGCTLTSDKEDEKETGDLENVSNITKNILEYLDCEYSYIGSGKDIKSLTKAYYTALEKGKNEGFTPVIVNCDRILAEAIAVAIGDEDGNLTAEAGKAYREAFFAKELPDAGDILERRKAEFAYLLDAFEGFDDMPMMPDAGMHDEETVFGRPDMEEAVIVHIPTAEPWKVFAWLPFGGFNDCPSNEELSSLVKLWHEEFGAYPAHISYDALEFHVERPVTEDKLSSVTADHFVVCPTIAEYVPPSMYAKTIDGGDMWSFWWD